MHQCGDLLANGEPQSRTAVGSSGCAVGLFKGAENGGQPVRRNADAGVDHLDMQLDAGFAFLRQIQGEQNFTGCGEFGGIAHEVDQNLPEAGGVALDLHRQARVHLAEKRDPLGVDFGSNQIADVMGAELRVEIDIFEIQFAGLDFGKIENIVDQRQQPVAAALDGLDVIQLMRVQFGFQEQVGEPDDAV